MSENLNKLLKLLNLHPTHRILVIMTGVMAVIIAILATLYYQNYSKKTFQEKIASLSAEIKSLKERNEYKINKQNSEEIKNIQNTYKTASGVYEKLLEFSGDEKKKIELQKLYALVINQLSQKNYTEASKNLADLDKKIQDETAKRAAEFKIPDNVKVNNSPPSSGFASQKVSVDGLGEYLVSIVSADLGSTRVIVDSASDADCKDNCPVLPLGEYVSRNGAFAGINGAYFCPAEYPSCAGKTNSFDTLLMNKNKKYLNSDNNVFSTVPAVIFGYGTVRFVSQSLEWGRDTSADGVLANHPLMVFNNQVVFGGNGDPKQGSKGPRGFVGATGNTVYIGIVHNATVAEAARVLNKMGIQNALNLDSGGSTALWSGGYKAGPGRNIPNAILFVQK